MARSAALVVVVAGGVFLPSALASGVFLHVSPSSVPRGAVVVFTGSGAGGCRRGAQVTLISRLFPGHAFGGEGAISARVGANGRFTRRYRIGASAARRTDVVSARCGGGNLGVTVKVRVR